MKYQDRAKIGTPEAVELSFALAGVGSRGMALAIDIFVQLCLLTVALLVAATVAPALGSATAIIVTALASFAVIYLYDVLFEAYRSGRTPGKEALGLRVIREGGESVDLRAAAIRNIVGLVDGPLTAYVVGMVSIFASKRNQRLGDMAAGTLVVRERFAAETKPPPPPPPGYALQAADGASAVASRSHPLAWDMSAIKSSDVTVVRSFLARRSSLDPGARTRLADSLAGRLRPLVAGAESGLSDEAFLLGLVAAHERR